MKEFQSINLDFVNGILFFIPVVLPKGGLPTVDMPHAFSVSYFDTPEIKVRLLMESLAESRKTIPPIDTREYWQQAERVFVIAKVKNNRDYDRKSLKIFVDRDETKFELVPCEYDRGGFSGIREGKFFIPADSTAAEISQAIDKTLALCIGKGGKRLADFLAALEKRKNNDEQCE
jgi:hypothetical protein